MEWEDIEDFYDSIMAMIYYTFAHKSNGWKLQKLQYWRELLRARKMSTFL